LQSSVVESWTPYGMGRPRVKEKKLATPRTATLPGRPLNSISDVDLLPRHPWVRRLSQTAPEPPCPRSDMLATLRRESWTLWMNGRTGVDRLDFDQKDLEPLLDAVGYA